MKARLRYDVVVIGAGVAGLTAAHALSADRRVLLLDARVAAHRVVPRVDSVPMRFLAWLTEMDIDPRSVGVDRVHDTTLLSWGSAAPETVKRTPMAHIERGRLVAALRERALAGPHAPDIRIGGMLRFEGRGCGGDGWQAARAIDASGRAAISARTIVGPRRPWVAQTFRALRGTCTAEPGLRIAALPDGYAYRLGARDSVCLGVVGRIPLLHADASRVEDYLRRHDAAFMLDGLGPLAGLERGPAAPAATRWTLPGAAPRIGDSALARDPMSSQGIANSVSDALYAVAALDHDDRAGLDARHAAQRSSHLRTLLELLSTSRHAERPTWREYAEFVARHAHAHEPAPRVALRDGRISPLPARPV